MVKRRNRKAQTIIDTTLSSPGTGTQYYATTLPNSLGYTDGFASSIWPMGTNVSFHNTGSSQGGDFGELNKLNYDNQIELYTPDTWRYDVNALYLSASRAAIGRATGSISGAAGTNPGLLFGSTDFNYSQGGPLAGQETGPSAARNWQPGWRNSIDFSSSADYFIPADKEGYVEFRFSSSLNDTTPPSQNYKGLAVHLVRDGVLYSGSIASGGLPSVNYRQMQYQASSSLSIFVGDLFPYVHTASLASFPFEMDDSNDPSSALKPSKGWIDTYASYFSGSIGALTSSDGDFYNTSIYGISRGPAGADPTDAGIFKDPTPVSQVNERYFRISREYDPDLYGNWIWKFQTKKDQETWSTFGSVTKETIENLTPYPDELMTSAYRPVIAFTEFYKFGRSTSSCQQINIESVDIQPWNRSAYSSHPTASTTYCYPAGFITNDGLYPLTVPTTPIDAYKVQPYKDYGLFWNVSDERANVHGEKRYPGQNSYEDFSSDIRYMGKDFSILPEFIISRNIDNMLKQPAVSQTNFGFLTLDGAEITSSGDGYYNGIEKAKGTNQKFYEDFSNSDFQSDLDMLSDQYVGTDSLVDASMDTFSISCDAILKLLPYEGFYPITRTNQIASIFSSSVDVSSSAAGYNVELLKYSQEDQSWKEIKQQSEFGESYINSPRLRGVKTQGAITPLFGPGILYNSIKSGISLGWTIVTGSSLLDTYSMWNTGQPFDDSNWEPQNVLQHQFLNTNLYNNPDLAKKIDFEALWDLSKYPKADQDNSDITAGGFHISYPEALQGYFSSSIGTEPNIYSSTENFMVRVKDTPDPRYEMAMNNFLAESVRFFLRDRTGVDPENNPDMPGQLSSLRTKTAAQIKNSTAKPIAGATYYMDVLLEMNPIDYTMCESYYNSSDDELYYNNFIATNSSGIYDLQPGQAAKRPNQVTNFSCSFNGRYFGPATNKWASYWNMLEPVSGAHYNVADPAQAPYTPPYYYGPSRVTLEYTAGDEWNDLTKDVFSSLFSKITASYYNPSLRDKINEGNVNASLGQEYYNTASFAYVMAQNVGDSLDLFGSTNMGQTTISPSGQSISNIYVPESTRWVISPKWECPVLNFREQNTDTIAIEGGLHPTCSFSSPGGFLDNTAIGTGRGMWSGYGKDDGSDKGLRISLEEAPLHNQSAILPATTTELKRTYNNSLLNLMGFQDASGGETSTYVGKLAPSRKLEEAVIAIPYLDRIMTSEKKYAETTDSNNPYSECFSDRFFFKIKSDLVFDGKGRPQQDRGDHISDMLKSMTNFVIPPQFDFITNRIISPIVMYIMPFDAILDKTDLQDIWQGVLPRIGIEAQERIGPNNSSITHPLNNDSFFGGKEIPPDIKWMVFKVKQRAESDYSKVTPDMNDNSSVSITNSGQAQARKYSYNWPYDFCSLIELGKIQTSFKIKK